MTDGERIAQLERDVKSLQECNNAAHHEIAAIKKQFNDDFIPLLRSELERLIGLYNDQQKRQDQLDRRTIGSMILR